MNGFFTMTWREIQARRMVFVAAAFAGIIPFLAPLVPGAQASNAAETRMIAALILSLSLAGAAAILIGSSVIVRDLTEQRLGFYFGRPLSVLAIWGGKLFAATFVVLAALVLGAVPTFLYQAITNTRVAGPESATAGTPLRGWIISSLALVIAVLVVVLMAHAISSAIRSRSRWLVFDVAMALLVGTVIWSTMRTLVLSGFWGVRGYWSGGFWADHSIWNRPGSSLNIPDPTWWLLGLCGALLAATYAQVAIGRTDPQRAHGAFSKTLWAIGGGCAVLLAALAIWVTSATPASLKTIGAGAFAPQGDWALVEGSLRHRGKATGSFLWNQRSGKSLSVPFTSGWVGFSGDGRHAAWLEFQGSLTTNQYANSLELVTVDLGTDPPRPLHSKIMFSHWVSCELSPSGARVAVVDEGLLSVYDVSSGKTLAGARLPEEKELGWASLYFLGEDKVRVFRPFTSAKSSIWTYLVEFDVATRKLETTGRLGPTSTPHIMSILPSRSGDRLLVVDGGLGSLRDAGTGALLAPLGEKRKVMGMMFLDNGGVGALSATAGQASLDVYSPAGALLNTVSLGAAAMVRFSGELEDGRLLVFLSSRSAEKDATMEIWKDGALVAVDPTTSRVTPLSR
ncbi:MAG: hypothetical protein ABIT01_20005, partial [Thermoanaerobaculia bacterium]